MLKLFGPIQNINLISITDSDEEQKKENKQLIYIAQINADYSYESLVHSKSSCHVMFIVDVSGSMGQSSKKIVNEMLPFIMQECNLCEIDLVTFSDQVVHSTNMTAKQLAVHKFVSGGTQMTGIPRIVHEFTTRYTNTKIILVSDGEVSDRDSVYKDAQTLSTLKNNANNIKILPMRLNTSSSFENNSADTRALLSLCLFSTCGHVIPQDCSQYKLKTTLQTPIVKFINANQEIIELVCNSKSIQLLPGSELLDKINLQNHSFFLVNVQDFQNPLPEFTIYNNEKKESTIVWIDTVDLKEETEISEYLQLLMNRIQVNMVLGTNSNNSKLFEFTNLMSKYFKLRDEINQPKEEKDIIPSIRDRYLQAQKQIQTASKSLLTNIQELANLQLVDKLSSQQSADFLRKDATKTRAFAALAKRQNKQLDSMDFQKTLSDELVEWIKYHRDLNEATIHVDSLSTSFYSCSNLFDVLKEISTFSEEIASQLSIEQILTLIGGIGIPFYTTSRVLADPWIFRIQNVHVDCTLSQADLWMYKQQARNANIPLLTPGTKQPISGIVPISLNRQDAHVMKMYLQNFPIANRIQASVSMMGVVADIPFADIALQASALLSLASSCEFEKWTGRHHELIQTLCGSLCATTKTLPILKDIRNNWNDLTKLEDSGNFFGCLKLLLVWLENPTLAKINDLVKYELYFQFRSFVQKTSARSEKSKRLEELLFKILQIDEAKKITLDKIDNIDPDIPVTDEILNEQKYDCELDLEQFKQTLKPHVDEISKSAMGIKNLWKKFGTVQEKQHKAGSPKYVPKQDLEFQYHGALLILLLEMLNGRDTVQSIIGLDIFPYHDKKNWIVWMESEVRKIYREQFKKDYTARQVQLRQERLQNQINELLQVEEREKFIELLNKYFPTVNSTGFMTFWNALTSKTNTAIIERRHFKIMVCLTGKMHAKYQNLDDFKDELIPVWNNGKFAKILPLDSCKPFFTGNDNFNNEKEENNNHPELWKYLMKLRSSEVYDYRTNAPNRHGYSNECPSFWAYGCKNHDELKATFGDVWWDQYVKKCLAYGVTYFKRRY